VSAPAVSQARSWLGYQSPEITARWDLRDVLTYALAVGADPDHDPGYLDEAAGPRMLPTFVTFAAGPWVPHLHRTIWAEQHGGVAASQAYRVHRPVPVVGQAATRVRVTGYEVKPSALLVWLATTTTGPDGPLLSGRHSVLFRGGGDRETVGETGSWADQYAESAPHAESRPCAAGGGAWLAAAVRIDPRAIPLYRLLLPLVAGQPGPDPLHADAGASASVWLGPPTLHGVAVLGHVGLALSRMLGDRIGGVSGFGARFRRPVHPGDTLAVSASRARPGAAWALRATDEAGQDVLDQAWIEIIEESP
jgi:hypothetical protein